FRRSANFASTHAKPLPWQQCRSVRFWRAVISLWMRVCRRAGIRAITFTLTAGVFGVWRLVFLVSSWTLVFVFHLTKASLVVVLIGCQLLFSACVSGPHFYLQYGSEYRELELEKILADNPLAPGDNIKVTNIGASPSASQHVVQIRDREFLHVHKIHDATV